ncbi:MAG TPA: leucyl aminopeptidase [Jatrophihabitans sp.]
MPTVSLVDPSVPIKADAVVVGVLQGKDGPRLAPGAQPVSRALFGSTSGGKLLKALKDVGVTGRPDQVVSISTLGLADFPVVVATGLGENAREAEALRRAAGAVTRTVTNHARLHFAISGPVSAIAEGALFGAYSFTDYKASPAKSALRAISIAGDGGGRRELARAKALAEAITTTRNLVNTPPNDLYPASFAAKVKELARGTGVTVEVLTEDGLKRGRYGAILAVGGGSVNPPRLVRLTYRPARSKATVALVGKGITFDSGGLNLKPGNSMAWMKSDMGGAAGVITSTLAIAALKLPITVIATVPMAENMPGGSAYRPSDVITMRSGKTVEVGNTDAEGRLVLADALSRAGEDEPDFLIETSTLTGAQLVALGGRVIGAMGEPKWRDQVVAAGNAVGEASWAMPLPSEYAGGLESPVADLNNISSDSWGGMLVAGLFLKNFMPDGVPWVHLDIAGPSFNQAAPHGYTPKGGTGAVVRTIVAAVESLTK